MAEAIYRLEQNYAGICVVKNMCGKSPMLAWGMKAQFAS